MTRPIRNIRVRISEGIMFGREMGYGPTLLLLHGSWSDSSQWIPVMEELASQYHCIAPDLLGFGESSGLSAPAYSIATEVTYLNECLTQLRTFPQIIVADSLGAWIAIRYCLRYPGQVQKLVVAAPEGIFHPDLATRWNQTQWLAGRWAPRYWMTRSVDPAIRLLGGEAWLSQTRQRRQLLRQHVAACRLLFQRNRNLLQAESLNGALPNLDIPLLILQSQAAPPRTVFINQLAQKLTPNAEIQTVSDDESSLWEKSMDEMQTWLEDRSTAALLF